MFIRSGCSSALILALKCPKVLLKQRWWCWGEMTGPLLSTHRCLCHYPPLPWRIQLMDVFHIHTHTVEGACYRPVDRMSYTRLCVVQHCRGFACWNDSLSKSLQYFNSFWLIHYFQPWRIICWHAMIIIIIKHKVLLNISPHVWPPVELKLLFLNITVLFHVVYSSWPL